MIALNWSFNTMNYFIHQILGNIIIRKSRQYPTFIDERILDFPILRLCKTKSLAKLRFGCVKLCKTQDFI